jgi:phosphoribosylformylglycinamidine cyclo-ligase
LQENGGIDDHEMLRTFNCGIGMVMLTAPGDSERVLAAARQLGMDCFDIGEVAARGSGARVRYHQQ